MVPWTTTFPLRWKTTFLCREVVLSLGFQEYVLICFNINVFSPRTLVLLRRSIYRVTRVNRLSKAFEGSDGTNLRRAMQAMLGKKTEELESLVRDSCGASALVV